MHSTAGRILMKALAFPTREFDVKERNKWPTSFNFVGIDYKEEMKLQKITRRDILIIKR